MIDWARVDTVFLDMDGTLLDLHYDNYFWMTHLPKRYAEIKGLELNQAETVLHKMFVDYRGSLEWYCLDFWEQELDLDLMPLKHEVSERVAYRPYAEQFLQRLKKASVEAWLVTNAHQGSMDIKFTYTNIKQYLDDIVTSHDYRAAKEHPDFWKALAEDKRYDPERTVFLDDNEEVLLAAKEAGIAQLISIAHPDSQKPERSQSPYTLLKDFRDIFPPENEQETSANGGLLD